METGRQSRGLEKRGRYVTLRNLQIDGDTLDLMGMTMPHSSLSSVLVLRFRITVSEQICESDKMKQSSP